MGDPVRSGPSLPESFKSSMRVGVGLLDILAGDLGHLLGEVTLGVDRIDQGFDPGRLQGVEVGLAVGRGHVDQPRSLVDGHLRRRR